MKLDLRSEDITSLTWWTRISPGEIHEAVFALVSPCCHTGFSKLINSHTARILPRLGRECPPYLNLTCLTCDRLFPPTPSIERLETHCSPRLTSNETPLKIIASWAEDCLTLDPLSAHLWAYDLFTMGARLAEEENWTPVLLPMASPIAIP